MDHEHIAAERPAIDQLIGLGYRWIDGAEFAPGAPAGERQSLRDVVLEPRLRAAVRRINPWISDDNLTKVVRDLTVVQAASLIEANQFIHESLVRYLSVDQDLGKGRKGQTVKVIDFDNPDNNESLVVSQFRVQGPTEVIVLDLVVFVNGLPLAVIECKSPYITDPMEAGIDQLMRYMNRRHPLDQEGAERLFWYNQVAVATYGDQARVGTVSALPEHFLEWKDPYPLTLADLGGKPDSQQTLLAGVFRRETFLDLVRNFVVFDTVDGRTIKKVARYQQFRAVCKAVQRLKTGGSRRERGGIVWHTQGSGKSLTMVFLAAKIAFTGTPLVKTQKTTSEFGTYIDTYKIDEAVRDGATGIGGGVRLEVASA